MINNYLRVSVLAGATLLTLACSDGGNVTTTTAGKDAVVISDDDMSSTAAAGESGAGGETNSGGASVAETSAVLSATLKGSQALDNLLRRRLFQ